MYLYVPVHTKFDLNLLHMVFFSLWTPGYVVLYMGSTYIHLATSKHCSQIEKPSIHLYGIYWYIPCFDNAFLVHTSTYWYIPKRLMMYFLILVYRYVLVCGPGRGRGRWSAPSPWQLVTEPSTVPVTDQ